jgi:hypothetical protein
VSGSWLAGDGVATDVGDGAGVGLVPRDTVGARGATVGVAPALAQPIAVTATAMLSTAHPMMGRPFVRSLFILASCDPDRRRRVHEMYRPNLSGT